MYRSNQECCSIGFFASNVRRVRQVLGRGLLALDLLRIIDKNGREPFDCEEL